MYKSQLFLQASKGKDGPRHDEPSWTLESHGTPDDGHSRHEHAKE